LNLLFPSSIWPDKVDSMKTFAILMVRPLWIGLLTLSLTLTAFTASRPNVLIVLTDDQGYGDFSCHGNPVLKTPAMDRLHAESVRFTDFHSAPMCTPTRGQLMSGVDAVRNGATSVTGGRSFFRPGIPTLPEMFASAGYRTGLFGKWHLGDNYPHRPMDRGFQEAVYHQGWGFTSAPEFANTLSDGRYFHNGVEKRFTGHCTDFWTDQAIQWMKAKQAKNESFFLYLPYNAPHGPCEAPDKYTAPYQGKGPANFFGMIGQVDDNLAKLDSFLKESGLRDNTILIFMTDNGGTAGVKTFNAGLREGKTKYYDGGHRVPCWVRWPGGKLGNPRDITVPAQMQDLAPTLLEFCQVSKSPKAVFDGKSLAKLLHGDPHFPERMLVVQYSRAVLEKWQCAVIWNQWRLVLGKELYDIHADLAQKNDLAGKHPEIVAKMRAYYEKWWGELEKQTRDFTPCAYLGAAQALVKLTSSDWQDVYCDNAGNIRNGEGGPRGGPWNVQVEQAGEYEIALRRWPREVDTALGAQYGPQSMTFPIAQAKVAASGREFNGKTEPTAKEAVVRVTLPAGKIQLQAWFQDAQGKDLCGAYYAYVTKVGTTTGAATAGRTKLFAGTGQPGYSGDGGSALHAKLNLPFGIVRGPDGCVYFCEFDGNVVRKVDAKGIISTIVGNGRKGPGGDGGPAKQAELNEPHEIRFDAAGDLYIADTGNHRIRKVNMKTGIISTLAGTGTPGFGGDDGPALQAQFKLPISLQFDPLGNLYICDIGNHRIRMLNMKSGKISTLSGNGQRAATPDGGPYANAPLNGPRTLDCDHVGNLWVVLREGNQVLRLDLKQGTVHLAAGTGKKGYTGNGGPATAATLNGPKGISVTPDGSRAYLADTENHCVRMIDAKSGVVDLVCGTGQRGDGPDGDPLKCQINRCHALFAEADGTLLIADSFNHQVRIIKP
jgi:arylsulfatase